jgi:hypothetical protein
LSSELFLLGKPEKPEGDLAGDDFFAEAGDPVFFVFAMLLNFMRTASAWFETERSVLLKFFALRFEIFDSSMVCLRLKHVN